MTGNGLQIGGKVTGYVRVFASSVRPHLKGRSYQLGDNWCRVLHGGMVNV